MEFDKGQKPTIIVLDKTVKTKGKMGMDFSKLVLVLQKYADLVASVWGCPATIVEGSKMLPGAWALVFLDDADTAGALGYHDLTPQGLPLGKVFVHTTLADGGNVGVTAAHELAEMMVDPGINMLAQAPSGECYAYEACDAVEESVFIIDGLYMSNFVFPSWFEAFRMRQRDEQFDYLKHLTHPLALEAGGYISVLKGGEWSELHGSREKEMRRSQKSSGGKRVEKRARRLHRCSLVAE